MTACGAGPPDHALYVAGAQEACKKIKRKLPDAVLLNHAGDRAAGFLMAAVTDSDVTTAERLRAHVAGGVAPGVGITPSRLFPDERAGAAAHGECSVAGPSGDGAGASTRFALAIGAGGVVPAPRPSCQAPPAARPLDSAVPATAGRAPATAACPLGATGHASPPAVEAHPEAARLGAGAQGSHAAASETAFLAPLAAGYPLGAVVRAPHDAAQPPGGAGQAPPEDAQPPGTAQALPVVIKQEGAGDADRGVPGRRYVGPPILISSSDDSDADPEVVLAPPEAPPDVPPASDVAAAAARVGQSPAAAVHVLPAPPLGHALAGRGGVVASAAAPGAQQGQPVLAMPGSQPAPLPGGLPAGGAMNLAAAVMGAQGPANAAAPPAAALAPVPAPAQAPHVAHPAAVPNAQPVPPLGGQLADEGVVDLAAGLMGAALAAAVQPAAVPAEPDVPGEPLSNLAASQHHVDIDTYVYDRAGLPPDLYVAIMTVRPAVCTHSGDSARLTCSCVCLVHWGRYGHCLWQRQPRACTYWHILFQAVTRALICHRLAATVGMPCKICSTH